MPWVEAEALHNDGKEVGAQTIIRPSKAMWQVSCLLPSTF